ncbi:MAG: hypothetical protein AAGJ46_13405 [Planctomycetota bacterium]
MAEIVFKRICLAWCLGSMLASGGWAVELSLTATMGNESRFFDYFSDAFAQVNASWPDETDPELDCPGNAGQACDGFFAISELPLLAPVGGGDRIFTRGPNLALGGLGYDAGGLTGAGPEAAPVTSFGQDADYAADIGGDDLISESLGPYTTIVDQSTVNGVVRFLDGVIVGIELEAAVTFDVPIPIFPGNVEFTGVVRMDDHRFSIVVGPENPVIGMPQLAWDIHGVVNQVLPGDYDDNGVVEAADYELWRSGFSSPVEPFTENDGNGDGLVDAADFTVWRDNLGLTSAEPTGATETPEPSAVALVVLAAASASSRRRVEGGGHA